jgi:hypothetical protein
MADLAAGQSNKQPGFWSSMPGILTGLAALLAAVAGLITVINRPPNQPHEQAVAPTHEQAVVPAPPPPIMSVLEYDTNRPGSDITKVSVADIEECRKLCLANEQCKAISFLEASNLCWLKGSVPAKFQLVGFTSAVKVHKDQ